MLSLSVKIWQRIARRKEINMEPEKLIQEIEDKRFIRIDRQRSRGIQTIPWASNIGECDRQIYYNITLQPEQKWMPSIELQARFIAGNAIEEIIFDELVKEGFKPERVKDTFQINDRDGTPLCRGKTDFWIPYDGNNVIAEVKSLNINVYDGINSVADFSKYLWAKKYPRQLMVYLYHKGEPYGLFIITDGLGHRKHFVLSLDDSEVMDEAEMILKRLRHVVDSVNVKTPPEYATDPNVCRNCFYYGSHCNPPLLSKESDMMQIITDEGYVENVNRYLEIQELHKEANRLEKAIKDPVKGNEKIYMAGNALITVKGEKRTKYDVPQDIKDQYKSDGKAWKVSIESLDIKKGD